MRLAGEMRHAARIRGPSFRSFCTHLMALGGTFDHLMNADPKHNFDVDWLKQRRTCEWQSLLGVIVHVIYRGFFGDFSMLMGRL